MRNIDNIMKTINSKFKEQIITVGTETIYTDKIPFSSPYANYMTYGGIPVGKVVEFFGGEGGGKTTSALDICGNAQKKYVKEYQDAIDKIEKEIAELTLKDTKEAKKKLTKLNTELEAIIERGHKLVAYVDAEQTLDTEWAQRLGVDLDTLLYIRPGAQSGEEVLQIILDIIDSGDVGLVVLDSIPYLVPQQIVGEDMTKKVYAGISAALSTFSSKVSSKLTANKCTLIGINQIREDLSSMYNTISTPGGKFWKHACSVRIQFKKGKLLDAKNGELSNNVETAYGNKVEMQLLKAKGFKPDRRLCYYTLNYFKGIDKVADTIQVAMKYGYVVQSGNWYYIAEDYEPMVDAEGKKVGAQGKGNLETLLKDDPELFEWLYDLLLEKIKGEGISE